jgi:hypothetical protein
MTFLYNFIIILFAIFNPEMLHTWVHNINNALGMNMNGWLIWFIGLIICVLLD